MRKLTFQDIRDRSLLLYEYIRGSQAYGMATPTSDEDRGGIFIAPQEQLLGLGFDYQDEVADDKHDTCWWELGKFMRLALKCSPIVLEALFIPEDKVLYVHPIFAEILKHRNAFLTKQCFKPFSAYAISQIEKARGQNKKIMWDINEMTRKTPLDYTYTFCSQGSKNIQPWLEERGLDQRNIGLVNIPNMKDVYGAYYDFGQHIRLSGITEEYFCNPEVRDDNFINYCWDQFSYKYNTSTGRSYADIMHEMWNDISIPKGGHCGIVSPNEASNELRYSSHVTFSPVQKGDAPICWVVYNQGAYENHCRKYKEYETWKKNRNKARYENNLEGLEKENKDKFYDCYLESETEFLTSNGWKRYDEITDEDLLGCFNDSHSIEFHPYLNRFNDLYTGEVYTYESPYIRFTVTPNHKLYLSQCHRSTKNRFSTDYDPQHAAWSLVTVSDIMNSSHSHYHQLQYLQNPKKDNPEYSDDFIKVLGLFLSEGCYEKKGKNRSIRAIRISQTNERKGCEIMNSIKEFKIKKYVYNYPERHKGNEYAYVCNDKNVVKIIGNCGEYAHNKIIPQFVYTFSTRQFNILLDSMMAGDGSFHKKGHKIYYTYSKEMAKTLHTLLLLNGYNSQLYGGQKGSYIKRYESSFKRKDGAIFPCYQVFISKKQKQHHVLNKNKHWTKSHVENARIVCFETIYGTLITRNQNKVAFHGNSKNFSHCFRLINTAIEIARGEGMKVCRKGIDADFLLDIRNRKYTYDELIKMVDERKVEMEEAMKGSTLPETIDTDFVNNLLLRARSDFNHENLKLTYGKTR